MKALEILKKLELYIKDYGCSNGTLHLVESLYKELEDLNKDCKQCKHHLSDNGNYPLDPCGSCTRFYADMFENKES